MKAALKSWAAREPHHLASSLIVGLLAPAWLWVLGRFSPEAGLLLEKMGIIPFALLHLILFLLATAIMLWTYPAREARPTRVAAPRPASLPPRPSSKPPPPPPPSPELDDLD